MKIKNSRRFPAALVFGQRSPEECFFGLVVKATFGIDGEGKPARPAAEQLPIFTKDEPYDPDNPGGLLRFELDLVPFKPRADIVLVGSAYSPNGMPTRVLDAELVVGRRARRLKVFGDRAWSFPVPEQPMPLVAGPAEFAEMPLTYDRAFGGADPCAKQTPHLPKFQPWWPRNFFGKGFIGNRTVESIDRRPMPNVEDPDHLITSWDTYPAPAGLGFYPRNSEPRSRFFGTYDERWRAERAPALPEDFRFDAFNGAAPELQVEGYLEGNEAVRLTNLAPRRSNLVFRLPCLRPVVNVRTKDPHDPAQAITQNPAVHLDTLVFIPDRNLFYQVWRSVIPVRDATAKEVEEIRVTYEDIPMPRDEYVPNAYSSQPLYRPR